MIDTDGNPRATSRRKVDALAALRACRRGEHVATQDIVVDALGVEHSHCRACGCELARVPVLRRWYQTGRMG